MTRLVRSMLWIAVMGATVALFSGCENTPKTDPNTAAPPPGTNIPAPGGAGSSTPGK